MSASPPEPNDFARVLGVLLGIAMVATPIAWLILAITEGVRPS